MEVRGSVALVTGGAAGLGRAIALDLARGGASVAINYSRSEAEADETLALVSKIGGLARAYRTDVEDWEAIGRMIGQVEVELGPVDILVNNAGITHFCPEPTELLREHWDRIIGVNLGGAFGCIRAVLPSMRSRHHGCVVNVASIAGITGYGSSLPYILSKAALLTMTRVLARDSAPHVRINAIAPGSMPTKWYERYYPPESRPSVLDTTPIGLVVEGVLSLITNEAVTGAVLVVDRGESLGGIAHQPNV